MSRSTRQRFDPNRSRTSAEIEKLRTFDARSDDIEERFAQTVGSWPHLKGWRALQISTAVFAGNDSQCLNLGPIAGKSQSTDYAEYADRKTKS
jgi:hypothetical protein